MTTLDNNPVWVAYQKLRKIRQQPEYGWRFWLGASPRHERHYHQSLALRDLCQTNPQAVYDLIFSDQVDVNAKMELMWFGRVHHGTVSKEYGNEAWQPFIDRVKARRDELPKILQDTLA